MKKLFILIILVSLTYYLFATGDPAHVLFNVVDKDGSPFDFDSGTDNVYCESWLKDFPEDILTSYSVGSFYQMVYNDTDPYSIVGINIGNFDEPWSQGDTLVAKFKQFCDSGYYQTRSGFVKVSLPLEGYPEIYYGFEPLIPDSGEPIVLNTFNYDPNNPERIRNINREVNGNNLTLTWDKVPNANSYKIYVSDMPDSGFELIDTISETVWETDINASDKKFFYVISSSIILK